MTSVCPSGAALAAASDPTTPPPPGRFSTTTGCPSRCASGAATTRDTRSVVPPAANGTIRRMGRPLCASAVRAANARTRKMGTDPIFLIWSLWFEAVVVRPAHQVLVAHVEHDRVGGSVMLDARPRRDRERVAETPVEALAVDH